MIMIDFSLLSDIIIGKGENNNMKKEIYDDMMDYYDSSYKILIGDYSELEELEKDPKVQKYIILQELKNNPYPPQNKDELVNECQKKFGISLEETNDIWIFMCELPYESCVLRFKAVLDKKYINQNIAVYRNIESRMLKFVTEEDKKEFESKHIVIEGNLDISDFNDRYNNARFTFFKSMIDDSQEKAVEKILSLYKKR